MAGSRIPKPEGSDEHGQTIDSGTLARAQSPFPGPIGLFAGPVHPQGKSKTPAPKAPPSPKFTIEVHDKSKITAEEWLKKIKDCDDVPDYFKAQIDAKDPLIYVPHAHDGFLVPNNVIPKDWLSDWLSAFLGEEWEMTTGNLDITVKKGGRTGPEIAGVLNPDLSDGASISGYTKHVGLTEKGTSTKDFKVEYGDTISNGVTLPSGRKKLIVVADRVTLHLDKITTIDVTDSELVNTWFHEIACHAGRVTRGEESVHGNADVNRCVLDINEMISKKVTTGKIAAAIDDFLKPSKPTHP
jgi:hypothetical protein